MAKQYNSKFAHESLLFFLTPRAPFLSSQHLAKYIIWLPSKIFERKYFWIYIRILTLDILFLVTITHLYDIKMIVFWIYPVGVDLDFNNVTLYYITFLKMLVTFSRLTRKAEKLDLPYFYQLNSIFIIIFNLKINFHDISNMYKNLTSNTQVDNQSWPFVSKMQFLWKVHLHL